MKNTKILALLLIVVFAFSLTLGVTAAQNDPKVAVELKSSTDNQVTVDLVIKNNPGFDLCKTIIYFDNELLIFDGKNYSQTGSIVPATKPWTPGYVTGEDKITCAIVTMPELFGMAEFVRVSGDGLLVSLTFDVVKDATGTAEIYAVTDSNNFVYHKDGEAVNIDPEDGSKVSVAVKDGKVVGGQTPTEPSVPSTDPTTPSTPTEPSVPPTEPIQPACEHKNTTETILKQPTCNEAGTKNVTCVDCGETVEKNAPVAATGEHTWKQVPGKEATCTEPGLTVGVECSVCGKVQKAQEPIEAGHTWVDATCEAPKTCSACDATEGEALPHTWVDATCSAPKTCSVCNKTEGTALEHEWVEEVVAPTCTVNGSKTNKCAKCGEKTTSVIDALGHKEEIVSGTPATCTATGLSDGVKCSVCGETIKEQETLPVIPHTYGDWTVSKEATCTATGLKVRSCACGASESEEIPMIPHEYKAVVTAPTCEDKGFTTHTCVCGDSYVDSEVKALGHKNNLVSENDEGKNYKCATCGETSFVPHEENPPTTDSVVTFAVIALVLMSASAVVIFNGKKWTIG